jgi:hypothetical protein
MHATPRLLHLAGIALGCALLSCQSTEALDDLQIAALDLLSEDASELKLELVAGATTPLTIQAYNASGEGVNGALIQLLTGSPDHVQVIAPQTDKRGIASAETSSTSLGGVRLEGATTFTVQATPDAPSQVYTLWAVAATRVYSDEEMTDTDGDPEETSSAQSSLPVLLPIEITIVAADE